MAEKPKHHTLRFNIEHRNSFNNIKNGSKRIETRAATKRYRGIKAGDTIVFKCGDKSFQKTVSRVTVFRTTTAAFKKYRPQDIRPDVSTRKEMIAVWHSFPNYKEKIAQHGLMAFEFEK